MSQNRFEKKFTKTDGCWIWNAATKTTGYGVFRFNGKTVTASRMSYLLYKGEIPDGLHVLHTCDNPLCVNPDHLFLGTNKDNVEDRKSKNRRVGRLKVVDEKQYASVQELLKTKTLSYREISRQTGISRQTICRISNNIY